jgi:hypothetical protein
LAACLLAVFCLSFFIALPLAAQDGFGDQGFGFGDEESGGALGGSGALAVSIGGEVSAAMTAYIDDFADGAEAVRLGGCFFR